MNSQAASTRRSIRPPVVTAIATAVCLLQLGLPAPGLASPPPWAPAHGYRHGPGPGPGPWTRGPRGSSVGVYVSPYVVDGRCNRESLGAVLGGAVGGVAGAQVGRGDGRTAAIIAGTIVGAIIGRSIGRSMDRTDVACVGQALEYGEPGYPVTWSNPDTGAQYRVTPGPSYPDNGGYCREFYREALIGGRQEQIYGMACRQPDGSWQIVR